MTKIIESADISNYIGYVAEPTDWFEVTQEQINEFAHCTYDTQYIHVDTERAKDTPFGTTVAHGFLSLSMLSFFANQCGLIIKGHYMGVNYGFEKVRFLAPVPVGSRIRCISKMLDIKERKMGQFLSTAEITIEIEGSVKPALIAHWQTIQLIK